MSRTARPQHVLEERSALLSKAIQERVSALRYGVTPKGSRPPFTQQMTTLEALKWWLQHRYDPLGMAIVQSWTPMQVAQLDTWLAQAVNHPSVQGQHGVSAPPAQPSAPAVDNRAIQIDAGRVLSTALGQERRIQGPPVGGEVS